MSAPWIVQFKMRQRFTLTLIRCASGILYTRKIYLSRWCSMMRVISYEAVAMRIIRSSNKLMLRESSAISSFRFVLCRWSLVFYYFDCFLFSLCSVCCTKYLFRSFFMVFSFTVRNEITTKNIFFRLLIFCISFSCLFLNTKVFLMICTSASSHLEFFYYWFVQNILNFPET